MIAGMPEEKKGGRESGRRPRARLLAPTLLAGLALISVGCWDTDPAGPKEEREGFWDLPLCDLQPEYLVSGGTGFDGIPSISDPVMVDTTNLDDIAYLVNEHRVIGMVIDGQPLAFPLSALWYHEVLNLDRGNLKLVVTHSTLTGSSRVFHRSAAQHADFGVSGFLYQNNLLFFDRAELPSLWAQLTGDARCGPFQRSDLTPFPFLETTWAGWKALFPNTLVLSSDSGSDHPWGPYPYGAYEDVPEYYFNNAMPELDPRLPSKERVLAIPGGSTDGVAFSFAAFEEAGAVAVGQGQVAGKKVVVFWRGDVEGAAAYWAEADGQPLTFNVQDGSIVDQETGTTWDFLGGGSGGGLDGFHLTPVPEATISYWGAWASFYTNTVIGEIG